MSCVCGGGECSNGGQTTARRGASRPAAGEIHTLHVHPVYTYGRTDVFPRKGNRTRPLVLSVWPRVYECVCTHVYMAAVDAQPCCWLDWGDGPPNGCWIRPSSLTPAFSSWFAQAFAGASAVIRALGGPAGPQVRPNSKSCDSLMRLGPGDGAVLGTGSSAAQTDLTQRRWCGDNLPCSVSARKCQLPKAVIDVPWHRALPSAGWLSPGHVTDVVPLLSCQTGNTAPGWAKPPCRHPCVGHSQNQGLRAPIKIQPGSCACEIPVHPRCRGGCPGSRCTPRVPVPAAWCLVCSQEPPACVGPVGVSWGSTEAQGGGDPNWGLGGRDTMSGPLLAEPQPQGPCVRAPARERGGVFLPGGMGFILGCRRDCTELRGCLRE